MQPSLDIRCFCSTMYCGTEENGYTILRLDYRGFSESATLPIHLLSALPQVVFETWQRMEQLQGTDVETYS